MKRIAHAWWRAAAARRLLTPWSAALTLPLAITVMGVAPGAASGAVTVFVSALAWAAAAMILLGASLALRIAARRRGVLPATSAGVVVTSTLFAVAAKLLVQDHLLRALGGEAPSPVLLPYRLATNAIVWLAVLSAIAVCVQVVHEKQRATAMLREVSSAMARAEQRAQTDAASSRSRVRDDAAALAAVVSAIRTREDLLAFADGVLRRTSHVWAQLADVQEVRAADVGDDDTAPLPAHHARPDGARPRTGLRLPPAWLVSTVYLAMMLPYALRTTQVPWLLIDVAVALGAGLVADLVPRRLRRSSPRRRVLVHLALAAVGGGVISLLVGVRTAGDSVLWLLPLFAFPATAAGLSWCSGLVHHLAAQERRAEAALRRHRRTLAATVHHRRQLREAAQLLHGETQGLCVLFLSQHPHPSPTDLATVKSDLVALLEALPARTETRQESGRVGIEAIHALLSTWRRVFDVRDEIEPAAAGAIEANDELAVDVLDIVAEALVNAVKHSDTTGAHVGLRTRATGAGGVLEIEVRTRGTLAAGTALRATSRTAMLGAVIAQDGADVRLLAALPVTAVVSPVHASVRPESGR